MPRYVDGFVNSSSYAVTATSDANLNNATIQTLSAVNFSINDLVVARGAVIGTTTYSATVNFGYGVGAMLALNCPSVTILNAGTMPNLAAVSIKSASLVGNNTQTVGDVSTLYIAGPSSISGPTVTGASLALKVASGNSAFGGNISCTDITCNSITANTATFSGGLSFSTPIAITDATNSTSTGTGCLTLAGGAGITKDVYVGGTLNCNALAVNSLNITSLTAGTITATSGIFTAGISITSGALQMSTRSPITSGSPYTLNFLGADNYTLIPINSAGAFTVTVPSGSNGQMLVLYNLGAGLVTVNITIDTSTSTFYLSTGGKMTAVWYGSTWLSIA